jgi:hypothetical protein
VPASKHKEDLVLQLGCKNENIDNSAGRCWRSLRVLSAILLVATLGDVGVEAAHSQA